MALRVTVHRGNEEREPTVSTANQDPDPSVPVMRASVEPQHPRPAGFPSGRVTLLGVLNVTPDSFSDGGRFASDRGPVDVAGAVAAAKELLEAGAHVIDVGGESTRPGAAECPEDVEYARTIPVIEALAEQLDVPISIDTRKAGIAKAALRAGARIINDVSGLHHDPAMASVAAQTGATVIVGHLRGTPETMQLDPHYDDVLREVGDELEASLELARRAGCRDADLVIDPGIGFGKRLEDNLALIANCGRLRERLGRPLLIGASRKGFLGALTSDPIDERDTSTAAASAIAIFAGADAVRVHDVTGAVRAAAVASALRDARAHPHPHNAPGPSHAARGTLSRSSLDTAEPALRSSDAEGPA